MSTFCFTLNFLQWTTLWIMQVNAVFPLYLDIRGLRKGPWKLFMGVVESRGFFLSVNEWEPCDKVSNVLLQVTWSLDTSFESQLHPVMNRRRALPLTLHTPTQHNSTCIAQYPALEALGTEASCQWRSQEFATGVCKVVLSLPSLPFPSPPLCLLFPFPFPPFFPFLLLPLRSRIP